MNRRNYRKSSSSAPRSGKKKSIKKTVPKKRVASSPVKKSPKASKKQVALFSATLRSLDNELNQD